VGHEYISLAPHTGTYIVLELSLLFVRRLERTPWFRIIIHIVLVLLVLNTLEEEVHRPPTAQRASYNNRELEPVAPSGKQTGSQTANPLIPKLTRN
jgi:hypothetical protein